MGSVAIMGRGGQRSRRAPGETGRMEILAEPGRVPERGTVVVPVGHDGTLGRMGESLDRASGGLLRRALAAEEGEQLVILPLIAGACAFAESELEKFTPLNDPGRPLAKLRKAELSEELVRVARAIDGVLRERMG